MQIEITGSDIVVDAVLVGELLRVPPAEVSELMRQNAITSVCERGIDTHQGQYRLSFFYGGRRARLSVDTSGHILQRSSIHIAKRP
ncbi:MAG: hypothetical protein BGP05_00010 [Rhizobiales bacterium 62-47]|nr:hypothetical protein [Hyphomicrobiales bacterium]OJY12491.1 MAG: hypothetical protein BGP05_00010 [Rhizobiales bacterium 62-47]